MTGFNDEFIYPEIIRILVSKDHFKISTISHSPIHVMRSIISGSRVIGLVGNIINITANGAQHNTKAPTITEIIVVILKILIRNHQTFFSSLTLFEQLFPCLILSLQMIFVWSSFSCSSVSPTDHQNVQFVQLCSCPLC